MTFTTYFALINTNLSQSTSFRLNHRLYTCKLKKQNVKIKSSQLMSLSWTSVKRSMKLITTNSITNWNSYITTWIKDFLHNRSQQIFVENKVSDRLWCQTGLDSILAYINYIQESVRGRVCRFADDTIVHNKITCICTKSLGRLIQSRTMGKEWSIKFNPDKNECFFRIYWKKETCYIHIDTSWHYSQNHRKNAK